MLNAQNQIFSSHSYNPHKLQHLIPFPFVLEMTCMYLNFCSFIMRLKSQKICMVVTCLENVRTQNDQNKKILVPDNRTEISSHGGGGFALPSPPVIFHADFSDIFHDIKETTRYFFDLVGGHRCPNLLITRQYF